MLILFWLPVSICLVSGVCFVVFGVRGLIERKPRVVSARPLRWAVLVTCVPNVGIALYQLFPLSGTRLAVSFLSFVVILPFVWLVFATWNRLNRYLVFGVTETAFRKALVHALNTLGMPFEEGLVEEDNPQVPVHDVQGIGHGVHRGLILGFTPMELGHQLLFCGSMPPAALYVHSVRHQNLVVDLLNNNPATCMSRPFRLPQPDPLPRSA